MQLFIMQRLAMMTSIFWPGSVMSVPSCLSCGFIWEECDVNCLRKYLEKSKAIAKAYDFFSKDRTKLICME